MCYVITCGQEGINGCVLTSGAAAGEVPTSFVQADSIDELAVQIGLDPAVLSTTVDEWNEMCARGEDALFERTGALKPINTAPYAAVEVYPGFTSTLSGILVDTEMHALSALNREPIGRLYIAGSNNCVAGRIYPVCGFGVTFAIVTGKITGGSAAALNKRAS